MGTRLSLCMIVRDEQALLPQCLDSVRGLADEIIVVDTGSRDSTPEIARTAGALVLHQPWTGDFAAARNAGLNAAGGDWILVLDADEYLHPEDRERLRPLLEQGEVEAYSLISVDLLDGGGFTESELSQNIRLWRNRPEYRFAGSVHEQIVVALARADARIEHSGVRIVHTGYLTSAAKNRRRLERNLDLARREVEATPDDIFHQYGLGMALQSLGRVEAATACFQAARRGLEPGHLPPWAPRLYKCLALCHLARRAWAELDACLGDALALFPDFTDLVLLQGLGWLERGCPALAVGPLQRCLAMGPAPVPPYLGAWASAAGIRVHMALARAYTQLNRPIDALTACADAAAGAPGWVEPLAQAVRILRPHVQPPELQAWLATRAGDPALQVLALLKGGDTATALTAVATLPPAMERTCLEALCLWALDRPAAAADCLTGPNAGELPGNLAGLLLACCQTTGPAAPMRALVRQAAAAACAAAARFCLEAAERILTPAMPKDGGDNGHIEPNTDPEHLHDRA